MQRITGTQVKYAFACIGAIYVLLFVGYLVFAAINRDSRSGPSELEAHPERQAEILAQRRAEELQAQLKLSDDQMQKITQIFAEDPAEDVPDPDDSEKQAKPKMDAIRQVLTPEQQAQLDAMRNQNRSKRNPLAGISPERIESLKQKMSPEQRQKFEKKMEKLQHGKQKGGKRGGHDDKRGGAR